jgi:DNA-binding Lrp family transcriptional regulator|tara:strand:- start:552 stop:1259 length:708 start_codon:yes stop_codon:yes gene_type:complete
MKYTIYINQKELCKTDFDLVDGAILDYLYFICNSKNEKIKKQRIDGYTWVDYKKILNDIPMMRIKSKGALSRRVKKMEDTGFIKSIERRKNGHKLKYFALTKKSNSLFTQTQDPILKKENPIHLNAYPIDEDEPISTIKDYTIKNNTIKIERDVSFIKPTVIDIKEFCKERKNQVDAETFFDFYESNDWLIGKNKMKNWKACLRNWEKRNRNNNTNDRTTPHRHQKGQDYGDGTF